jgi:hypothetical protein
MSHTMIVDEGSTDVDALREELTFELIVLHTEVMELNKKWDFSAIVKSASFRSQKLKGYADSPGLKRPGALEKPRRPGSVQLTRYDKNIPGIYLSYVPTQ